MKHKLKGLYVITDKKLIERPKFVQTVEKALAGGANVLQLREKETPYDEIVYLGRELLRITTKYSVPLIINDKPELAKEIGADGVHLGQRDTNIEQARRIVGEDKIIGVSCYGEIDRGLEAEAGGADYLAFGTPYDTLTKPGRKPTAFSTLIEAKAKISNIPIFAIGGITKENAQDVLGTGVDGIAVITSVFGSSDPESASRELYEITES
ncbi:MAG: thiamine phosphate synthase [Candidatus Dadabacteria bacterium]|nr:thiamine phosphate synthase [Candidatus Dadabacteria bacterium]NIS09345.1 thiamine phosphate synthase [Candidatus Dadabacteria bacterium]NIV42355.1 thiamine phosphate synthase [Candidatus Dadabacteria bacterium]NIX15881.1 thiamine phosphate synthase [Candidatus Dadabacteria bacterium]NIY22588.1 thiamine phosphate synthase [Candidatus Dadabacteria bacterium]